MWIYLNDAHLSIVAHRDQPEFLLVRSRTAGDIERVFGSHVKVERMPHADYEYRTAVRRQEVANLLAEKVLSIDYDNFKGSITDPWRHTAYLRVWGTFAQEAGANRRV